MVKAVFHKNQRVFVAPVGTWATVERVIPHWVKGIEEPLRVFYDCGLGREFDASELAPERPTADVLDAANESWAVFRRENRWQSAEDSAHHPAPGTHPVIVTAENARGGWRVPGAEYDLAPERYEAQARVMAAAPRLLRLAKTLVELSSEFEDEIPLAVHDQHGNVHVPDKQVRAVGIEHRPPHGYPGITLGRDIDHRCVGGIEDDAGRRLAGRELDRHARPQ